MRAAVLTASLSFLGSVLALGTSSPRLLALSLVVLLGSLAFMVFAAILKMLFEEKEK